MSVLLSSFVNFLYMIFRIDDQKWWVVAVKLNLLWEQFSNAIINYRTDKIIGVKWHKFLIQMAGIRYIFEWVSCYSENISI